MTCLGTALLAFFIGLYIGHKITDRHWIKDEELWKQSGKAFRD